MVPHEAIYGLAGRKRFHVMLSNHVFKVYRGIEALYRAMREAVPTSTAEDDIQEIADLLDKAQRSVRKLTLFLLGFRDLVWKHLLWLAERLRVTRPAFKLPEDSPLRSQENDYRNGPDSEGDSEIDHDEIELKSLMADFQCVPITDLASLLVTSSQELKKRRWVDSQRWCKAANEWLHIICLHDSSMLRVVGNNLESDMVAQYRLSKRIVESNVLVVEVECPRIYPGSRTAPLRECVEYARRKNKRINVEKAMKMFRNDEDDRSANPSTHSTECNNTHREAFKLALLACKALSKPARKKLLEEWLEYEVDTTLNGKRPNIFTALRPWLADLKRCCPSCTMFSETCFEQDLLEKDKLPGVAPTKWTACSLPPFTPAAIGKEMLDKVRRECVRRLERIQSIWPVDEDEDECMNAVYPDPPDRKSEIRSPLSERDVRLVTTSEEYTEADGPVAVDVRRPATPPSNAVQSPQSPSSGVAVLSGGEQQSFVTQALADAECDRPASPGKKRKLG